MVTIVLFLHRILRGVMPCLQYIFINVWNQGHMGPDKIRNGYTAKVCLVDGLVLS